MKKTAMFVTMVCINCLLNASAFSWDGDGPLIIDHTQTDFSMLPTYRIEAVKSNIKYHYAHTSHGSQLTAGIDLIEVSNPLYAYTLSILYLPDDPEALCILDGQIYTAGVSSDEYWRTSGGMNDTRNVLDLYPNINVSMWSWCTELNYFPEEEVIAYLDSISTLEAEYPQVTFVYMTGNAQVGGTMGYNRHLRNELIRQYCRDNNKVLYDFAELDSWWYNPATQEWEHYTYEYDGHTIHIQHPQFDGEEAGHTTYESCEQKGRALWWLLTRIEGGAAGDTLAVYEQSWGTIKSQFK